MARLADRHPRNAPGGWYVDTRCIACDASRHHAPGLIGAGPDGRSFVTRQPASPDEEAALWRAALACPTRSIGTLTHRAQPPGVFPYELTDGVFLCGYNDRRSFGAHAWFVPGTAGGFLVDSPRWSQELVGAFEAAGGIGHVLLTHRDDVADAQRYAEHFDARVWIHQADLDAAPFATDILGDDETLIAPGLIGFPVPGHTEGSVLYLHQERHLFTGDTLAWLWRDGDLGAFRDATWFSWSELRASLARLLASGHRFDWVCPGHGAWHGASSDEMNRRLGALVERM